MFSTNCKGILQFAIFLFPTFFLSTNFSHLIILTLFSLLITGEPSGESDEREWESTPHVRTEATSVRYSHGKNQRQGRRPDHCLPIHFFCLYVCLSLLLIFSFFSSTLKNVTPTSILSYFYPFLLLSFHILSPVNSYVSYTSHASIYCFEILLFMHVLLLTQCTVTYTSYVLQRYQQEPPQERGFYEGFGKSCRWSRIRIQDLMFGQKIYYFITYQSTTHLFFIFTFYFKLETPPWIFFFRF